MKKKLYTGLIVTGAVALGLGGGALTAQAFTAGSSSQGPTKADYSINDNGQTYGSAALANDPAAEPDLIAVIATNGKAGYALKDDLDRLNGSDAASTFKTPEEALAWQNTRAAAGDQTVPVYENDGTTMIGEFTVYASSPGQ